LVNFLRRKNTFASGKKNPHLSKTLYKRIYALKSVYWFDYTVLNTKQLFAIKAIVGHRKLG